MLGREDEPVASSGRIPPRKPCQRACLVRRGLCVHARARRGGVRRLRADAVGHGDDPHGQPDLGRGGGLPVHGGRRSVRHAGRPLCHGGEPHAEGAGDCAGAGGAGLVRPSGAAALCRDDARDRGAPAAEPRGAGGASGAQGGAAGAPVCVHRNIPPADGFCARRTGRPENRARRCGALRWPGGRSFPHGPA
jgi:hypothetical protein